MAAILNNPLPSPVSLHESWHHVAIIGAGAAGVLSAVHINRIAPWLKVALVDGGRSAGRGLAYATTYCAHLLNVRAGAMSALASDPGHFARWLATVLPDATPDTFAPRSLYGDYLQYVLASSPDPSMLEYVQSAAVSLERTNRGFAIGLIDGSRIHASAVVLAVGNSVPADPLNGTCTSNRYVRDPWSADLSRHLQPAHRVLVIGSGLTMIDTVLTLRREGLRSPIHVLSRHGGLPATHRACAARPFNEGPPPATAAGTLRWLRQEIERAAGEGHDWRAVIDGLRPHTARIWQEWSAADRARFLRHARWAWDRHRHRMAPEVGAEIDGLIRSGDLVLHQGRVRSVRESESSLSVRWDGPAGRQQLLRAHRLINCTGPATDYARLDDPMIAQLRRSGWLQPDPLGLGIETDHDGQLLDRHGRPVPGLLAIGPPRRATLWESTAIPEIRSQATKLAQLVLRQHESA